MPKKTKQSRAKRHSSSLSRWRRRNGIASGPIRRRPRKGRNEKNASSRTETSRLSRLPSPIASSESPKSSLTPASRRFRRSFPLVFDRASKPGFAVAVLDRFQRPVRRVGVAAELPLDEAVARRIGVVLVGGPGDHHHHPGHAAAPSQRQLGKPRQAPAGRAGSPRRRSSRGRASPAPAGRRSAPRPGDRGARRLQAGEITSASAASRKAAAISFGQTKKPCRIAMSLTIAANIARPRVSAPQPGGDQQRPHADDPELWTATQRIS